MNLIWIVVVFGVVRGDYCKINVTDDCVRASICDFPEDVFTEEQRIHGAVVFHFLCALYFFIVIATVCDNYFLPSIECICTSLDLSKDVAGATFMAVATSAPELFVNIFGTFITETDMGMGTIVGSALFNSFGVTACISLAAKEVLSIGKWPTIRDCVIYIISVSHLSIILADGLVEWYESLSLIIMFVLYFCIMFNNKNILKLGKELSKVTAGHSYKPEEMNKSYLPSQKIYTISGVYKHSIEPVAVSISPQVDQEQETDDYEIKTVNILSFPRTAGAIYQFWWVLVLPINIALFLTIPDCKKRSSIYPGTFIMCIAWIAGSAYVVSWMVTIIGDTFWIPDSAMGLTFIAAGGSLPELFSSIILARKGVGSIGLSNSIGACSMDILMNMGFPWFIKAMLHGRLDQPIKVVSAGMLFEFSALLASIIILLFIIICFDFRLQRVVGVISLVFYLIILTSALLLELNVFFPVNPPTCRW